MVNSVMFIGSKELGLSILSALYRMEKEALHYLVTIDDSDDERSCLSDYATFSEKYNIPLSILEKPSGLELEIKSIKPEVVIVGGWYWLIKPELLSLVPGGFVGIHGSLLPKYRGFAPFVWAILNGEEETGVSLFYFDKAIDNGDIIAQKKITISKDDYISDILEKAKIATISMLNEYYPLLLNGRAPRRTQETDDISYCSVRTPADGVIDWTASNIQVYNFIRAQSQPYPGAFSFIMDKKYFIHGADIFDGKYYGVPGVIAQRTNSSVVVCCGEGAIILTDMRSEPKGANVINKMKFKMKFGSII